MNLTEHAQMELKIAGFDLQDNGDTIDSYGNKCAQAALELVKTFAEQGHSGYSAGVTLSLFKKLANWENITDLTDNPTEWTDTVALGYQDENSHGRYQSKRNSSCFSDDLKTYWDINDEENRIFEYDEEGNKTGWSGLKDHNEIVKKELRHV